MPTTLSPLRYPGGKTRIYPFIREILKSNGLLGQTYIEPFAGGAGLALKLLFNNDVKRIVINDFDPAIFAIWNSVLNYTEEFCNLIIETDVTVQEWHTQRNIYQKQNQSNSVEFGFATFFLNRTNMSGVIKGGVIGGYNQNGNFKLDARYNKAKLIEKIKLVAQYHEFIDLYNLDAKQLISSSTLCNYENALIYFDPPYVKKGAQLYENSFTQEDHISLSERISTCERKWIVTYDICPLVAELYQEYRRQYLDVTYSIQTNKKSKEYIFYSNNLIIPE